MITETKHKGWWACKAVISAIALMLFLPSQFARAEQNAPLGELQTAEQIRQLTPQQAKQHYPVRLRGVVTFLDQDRFWRFMQDGTAGIYFDDRQNNPPLTTGQTVEIQGETSPGEYVPIVLPHKIQILPPEAFPTAKQATYEQLASGQEDSQFVEVRGIVRSAAREEQQRYYAIEIATGGGRLTALATELPKAPGKNLVDSTVRIRGVCVTRFNGRRQLFDIRLLVPRPEDLVIETPAENDPFAISPQPIERLMQFTPRGPYGHRVKVVGTVIYAFDDNNVYIQDQTEGLHVQSKEAGLLSVGDRVEALGFPAKGEYIPMLQDGVFRKIGTGHVLEPDQIATDEALKGTHDCRLVRIEATVLDRARYSGEQFLVLQSDGFIFHAYMETKGDGSGFAYLQKGSKVAVTGVCLIETGSEWNAGDAWRAKSFRILLRSAQDVVVLQLPPGTILQKLLWIVAILGVIVLATFTWVVVLRRRVHKQTEIIRERLQVEAALKERYQDLFENANDMVFTHDLSGWITSINKAGERFLQLPREKLYARNIVELVAADQRLAARQWLEQIVKGVDVPSAEWDFVSGSGHRGKMEIVARLIEQDGKKIEIEGIARDITERRRLEREILEISNREQRRIGHDLHDGVCQQLAGIAYLLDILSDRLQERAIPESVDADKIGSLINEANAQARSVARGLFPIRLEDNGLVWAMEELADNASNRFKIRCRFSSQSPPSVVDIDVALHLYYIVQEALANAVRHGKASRVDILLAPEDNRYTLTVQDDGEGFKTSRPSETGMGIRIMRYRAKVIGATLDLKSQPGEGTQIVCKFNPVTREILQTMKNGSAGK